MDSSKNKSDNDKRTDRRQRPTPLVSKYTFRGRRKTARRGEEKYNYYVDRLGFRTWLAIGIVIFLSVTDSLFTLYFLNRGFQEANPVMDLAILLGTPVFIVAKYLLTIFGILILALHKNFRYVKFLITVIILLYTFLNVYHIWLYINHV